MNKINPEISIVVPAFNEETNLKELCNRVIPLISNYSYEIIFVDDGSSDKSIDVLKELHSYNNNIHYISFSRNFGHQSALKAGLDWSRGEAVISMDADLQHPPYLIPELIQKWKEGYDIVYTQRKEQKDLPFLKKLTSKIFYKLINSLSDTYLENGAADFRLLDRKVVQVIKNTIEGNLFIRGFISWVGFKQYKIEYMPEERFSGTSKYTFKKMLMLASNGITSFSIKPLRLSIILGSIISFLAFVYGFYAIYAQIFTEKVISGWTSLMVSVLFIGGLQLLMIGIIGEYLGKAFMQVKGRPDYIVKSTTIDLNM